MHFTFTPHDADPVQFIVDDVDLGDGAPGLHIHAANRDGQPVRVPIAYLMERASNGVHRATEVISSVPDGPEHVLVGGEHNLYVLLRVDLVDRHA